MERLRAVRYLGIFISLSGAVVALGWIFDIQALKSFWPGAVLVLAGSFYSFILVVFATGALAIAEKKSRESDEKFRAMFEKAGDAIFIADPVTRELVDCNEKAQILTGYTRRELLSMRADQLHPEYSAGKTMEAGFKKMVDIEITAFPTEVLTKNKKIVPVDVNGFPVRFGERTFLVGIFRDMTDSRRRKIEIDNLNLKNKAILASVPDIIMEVDARKVYTWANRCGYEFFGEDVLGKEANHYFVGEQMTYETVRPIFDGMDDHIYVESWQKRRDGRARLLAWWTRVLKDAEGVVIGAVSTARDITEFKEMEEAKNMLIRNISHSVKTPIATTETAINLIRFGMEKKDDEQVKLAAAIASRNIGKVRRDIGNMLSLFVIDMKKEGPRKTGRLGNDPKASLHSAVSKFTDDISYLLQKKGINVGTEIPVDADNVPLGENDLRIVMENLLDNALKFTEKGSVMVKSRRMKGRFEIEVADTGSGLELGEKDRIFDKFYKHEASTDGIGLGLTICKDIISGYGGTIEAFSEGPYRGTAMIIKLPDKGV
ncbi:MAG: PAS domain S-box protein [Candidatus Omnitrophica bacterium]|nr:PAS domain S-box protein [Candidatus Omnitrophota bacterium]